MTTAAKVIKLSFEEFVHYEDGSGRKFELEDGVLLHEGVPVEPTDPEADFALVAPYGRHDLIAHRLVEAFNRQIDHMGVDWIAMIGNFNIKSSSHTGNIPDVYVFPSETIDRLDKEAVFVLEQDMPLLVIEVVSPTSRTRDYEKKRGYYAEKKIPEYWIVNFLKPKVKVLTLEDEIYADREFLGAERIVSRAFPQLQLSTSQVLSVQASNNKLT